MNLIVAPYFKKFILLAILHNIIHTKYVLIQSLGNNAFLLHLDQNHTQLMNAFSSSFMTSPSVS